MYTPPSWTAPASSFEVPSQLPPSVVSQQTRSRVAPTVLVPTTRLAMVTASSSAVTTPEELQGTPTAAGPATPWSVAPEAQTLAVLADVPSPSASSSAPHALISAAAYPALVPSHGLPTMGVSPHSQGLSSFMGSYTLLTPPPAASSWGDVDLSGVASPDGLAGTNSATRRLATTSVNVTPAPPATAAVPVMLSSAPVGTRASPVPVTHVATPLAPPWWNPPNALVTSDAATNAPVLQPVSSGPTAAVGGGASQAALVHAAGTGGTDGGGGGVASALDVTTWLAHTVDTSARNGASSGPSSLSGDLSQSSIIASQGLPYAHLQATSSTSLSASHSQAQHAAPPPPHWAHEPASSNPSTPATSPSTSQRVVFVPLDVITSGASAGGGGGGFSTMTGAPQLDPTAVTAPAHFANDTPFALFPVAPMDSTGSNSAGHTAAFNSATHRATPSSHVTFVPSVLGSPTPESCDVLVPIGASFTALSPSTQSATRAQVATPVAAVLSPIHTRVPYTTVPDDEVVWCSICHCANCPAVESEEDEVTVKSAIGSATLRDESSTVMGHTDSRHDSNARSASTPSGAFSDGVREGSPMVRLRCLHSFHANCIQRWLLRETTCPMCRREVAATTSPSFAHPPTQQPPPH